MGRLYHICGHVCTFYPIYTLVLKLTDALVAERISSSLPVAVVFHRQLSTGSITGHSTVAAKTDPVPARCQAKVLQVTAAHCCSYDVPQVGCWRKLTQY